MMFLFNFLKDTDTEGDYLIWGSSSRVCLRIDMGCKCAWLERVEGEKCPFHIAIRDEKETQDVFTL